MDTPPPLPPELPPLLPVPKTQRGFPLWWFLAGTAALLLAVVVILLALFGPKAVSGLESWVVDARLTREVEALSRKTPKMVDRVTRLDRAEYVGHREIEYEYTLTTYKVEQLDVNVFLDKLRETMREKYRIDSKLNYFRRHSVVLRHRYKDMDGQPIGEIEFNLGHLDD